MNIHFGRSIKSLQYTNVGMCSRVRHTFINRKPGLQLVPKSSIAPSVYLRHYTTRVYQAVRPSASQKRDIIADLFGSEVSQREKRTKNPVVSMVPNIKRLQDH